MPEEVVVLIMFAMGVSLLWGLLGTIKSIKIKKYEAQGGPDLSAVRQELADVRRRVDGIEDGVMMRLQDLEERLDFTERVLAQSRREGQLPPRS